MVLPKTDTPLYNHSLPKIEAWLQKQGCEQNRDYPHCWLVERLDWKAEICLETEELTVRYINAVEGNRDVQRSFKYSLSRQDIEAAIFSGP